LEIALGQKPSRGVLGRIDDDQFSFGSYFCKQVVDIKAELIFLQKRKRDRSAASKIDHRFIDREAGIGINDFISCFDQRQNQVKHDGFRSWCDDNPVCRNAYPARTGDGRRNSLA
jgi:hypothetical protein